MVISNAHILTFLVDTPFYAQGYSYSRQQKDTMDKPSNFIDTNVNTNSTRSTPTSCGNFALSNTTYVFIQAAIASDSNSRRILMVIFGKIFSSML